MPWEGVRTGNEFHKAHQRTYAYANPGRENEYVRIRVRETPLDSKQPVQGRKPETRATCDRRWVSLSGRGRLVAARARDQIPQRQLRGPALVLYYGSTPLVSPRCSLLSDERFFFQAEDGIRDA